MDNSVSIYSIIRFNTWVVNYGVQKAGLPADAMSPLYQSSTAFQAKAMGLRNNLLKVKESWQGIIDKNISNAAVDNAAIRLQIQHIAAELYDIKLTTQALLDDSAKMKVQVIEANSLVQSHVDEGSRRLKQIELDIAQAARKVTAAQLTLEQAKAELEGGLGFANGLLTGLTFGLYNRVGEKIDEAKNAKALADVAFNQHYNLRYNQTRIIAEQAQAKTLLEQLVDIEKLLTNFQNSLNTLFRTLGDAFDNESKFVSASTAGAASYYFKASGKDMDRLFIWMDSFYLSTDAMQINPSNVCSLIRGNYECHQYDAGGKNDWHYVTIIKLSDHSAMWTNRAGVSWVLQLTHDTNQLDIGPDCPYYDIYKQAKIHWKGNVVTGITGPGNSLYEKS